MESAIRVQNLEIAKKRGRHSPNQLEAEDKLIHLINRWRTDQINQGKGGTIIDVYAELDALLPTLINLLTSSLSPGA
jgi:hypothetical protein